MELRRVNSVLSKVVYLLAESGGGIAVGETFENDFIRVHRYVPSFEITDLSNAGKRGKLVDSFSLYDTDDDRYSDIVDKFSADIKRCNYKDAINLAMKVVDDCAKKREKEKLSGGVPKVEFRKSKGVYVAPPGFKKIKINGKHVVINADINSFHITDKDDKYNEQTMIAPIRGKATAVKQFLIWARENEDRLAGMTFSDISRDLGSNGIQTHYYCAVD